jgi:hypothetical protein
MIQPGIILFLYLYSLLKMNFSKSNEHNRCYDSGV